MIKFLGEAVQFKNRHNFGNFSLNIPSYIPNISSIFLILKDRNMDITSEINTLKLL